MTRALSTLAGVSLALGLAVAAQPAVALECPAPRPVAGPGVLQETAAQIDVLAKALATGDVRAKTQDIIAGLRAAHPDAQPGEILNYLITAYCPVAAAAPGLNEGERQAAVDQYVLLVRAMLY